VAHFSTRSFWNARDLGIGSDLKNPERKKWEESRKMTIKITFFNEMRNKKPADSRGE